MKKRRMIALLLSLVLLLCNTISVVAAEPAHAESGESAPDAEPSTVDLTHLGHKPFVSKSMPSLLHGLGYLSILRGV